MSAQPTHRHSWDLKGNAPAGSIRTCLTCGTRQVKQAQPTGGLSWQSPAWLRGGRAS